MTAAQTRSSRAVNGVLWSAINIAVPSIASLLVFIVISRLLSPVDFGVVAAAAALAAGASALVPAGFGDALVQRMEKDARTLDTVFWFCLMASVVMYAALVGFRHAIAHVFHIQALTRLLPVLGLRVIWDAAAIVPTALITQALSFRLLAIRTIVATLISSAVSLGFALVGWGFWALAMSMLVNSLVAAVAVFLSAGWKPRAYFRPGLIRDLAGYGAFASGTRMLTFAGTQLDQAFVGLVLGPYQLGLYNFARRVFSLLNDVTGGAINAVAHPLFAGIQNDRERVRRGFLIATFLSSAVAFPCFTGLACVAHHAIPLLFGPQWVPALWPLRILCGLGMISCIGMLQAGLITSIGLANWWFYYQLATNLLNIPIIIFIAPYGTTPLVAAITAKAFLLFCVPMLMTLKLLSLRAAVYVGQFIATLAATAAMSAAIGITDLLCRALPNSITLAAEVGAGGSVYAMVLFVAARPRVDGLITVVRAAIAQRGVAPQSMPGAA